MANETTTTTLTEIVNSEWIRPAFQDYAADWLVATQFLLRFDLRGRGTATVAVPSIISDMGTVSDGGAGVDTEYDATEATDLTNTTMDLSEATISTSEYGVMRTITDTALEDTVDGFNMIQEIVNDSARILATALEDDVCALFAGFGTTVGTSGSPLTLTNMSDGVTTIRAAGVRAPDGIVFVLDDEQASEYEAALISTNAAAAVYAGAADRLLSANPTPNNGLANGHIGFFRQYPVYMTGLTDTANMGADVVGAAFVRGDTAGNARMAALGLAVSREFTVATERNESLRATEVVATQRMGVGELLDAAGVKLVTDAP